MGWDIPWNISGDMLGIIGLILCITLFILYIVWTKSKEGFTTAPTIPPFVCPSDTREIPCPEGTGKCCEPTDPYERVYVGLIKSDSALPVPATPITTLERDISGSVAFIDDTIIRDTYEKYSVIESEYDLSSSPPVPVTPPVNIPDFAIALGAFDSDVSTIPWDADNASSIQSETMWGYVSPECSKSIWNKVYAENQFATTQHLQQSGNTFTYKSTLLGININDPTAAAAEQVGEFLFMAGLDNAIYSDRSKKIFKAGRVTFTQAATKVNKAIGAGIKNLIGGGRFKQLRDAIKKRFASLIVKKTQQMGTKILVQGVAAELTATMTAVALQSNPVTAPAAPAAIATAATLKATLGILSTAVMVLSMLAQPIMAQLLDDEGTCPNGMKDMNSVIPASVSTIFESVIPVAGDIISTFRPYVCFGDGKIEMKKRLKGQPYADDNTLSIAYANAPTPTKGYSPKPLQEFEVQATESNGAPRTHSDGSPMYVPRAWCNFANPIMLDRMANFYYKHSYNNYVDNGDGTIDVEIISRFAGVVASSELSCDVVCATTTYTYDNVLGVNGIPLTKEDNGPGSAIKITDKGPGSAIKITDKGPVYRRFYFIKKSTDPPGYFTVTGCTYVDDAAPEATNPSSSQYGTYVPSLPKVFKVTEIAPNVDVNAILSSQAVSTIGMGIMMKGGIAGGLAVTAGSASAQTFASDQVSKAGIKPVAAGSDIGVIVVRDPKNSGIAMLQSRDEYYNINLGTVVETAYGYGPEIQFCATAQLTVGEVRDPIRLREVIDSYHVLYPNLHVKTVHYIDPRGLDACYYKWETVNFNPATNEEDLTRTMKEVLVYYTLMDKVTCVWKIDVSRGNRGFDVYPGDSPCPESNDPIKSPPRCYTSKRYLKVPPSIAEGVTRIYPTWGDRKDASGNTYQAPLYPRTPFDVPRPLPPKGVVLGTCGSCITNAQINKSIIDFNTRHINKKVIKVLNAWTSTPTRCDYQVEMLRIQNDKRIIQKETVSMTMSPTGTDCIHSVIADGSDKINSGTFIQATTPPLATQDTSGGIFGYKIMIDHIQKILNTAILPLINAKPDVKIPAIATNANKSVQNLAQLVFNNQKFETCPAKTCKDPDILTAIMDTYNEDKYPTDEFYVEKRSMGRILKAGIASKDQCDVIFEDVVEQYDDILQKPTRIRSYGATYRFRLTPTGNPCSTEPYMVKPRDYYDASQSQIGVRAASTIIANGGFSYPHAQVDCMSKDILRSIKDYFNVQNTTASPMDVTMYTRAKQSFARGPLSCEYQVTKSVIKNVASNPRTRQSDTYLKVDFNPNGTVRSGTEYDLANVEEGVDLNGNPIMTMFGAPVTLPFLTTFETSMKNSRVNTTATAFP